MKFFAACRLKLLLCSLALSTHGLASAAETGPARCPPNIVKQVGKHFHLVAFSYPKKSMAPSVENGGLIVDGTCTDLQSSPTSTLAAFAYDAGDEFSKKLLVALVDTQSGKVQASYVDRIDEDAGSKVEQQALYLDSAIVPIAPQGAVALSISTNTDRCTYEGGSDPQRILFSIEGKRLRPVFKGTMGHWAYLGGGRCDGKEPPRVEANIEIAVEENSTLGFADIKLTGNVSSKHPPLSMIVKYNGKRYDLSTWEKSFSSWWDKVLKKEARRKP